MTDDVDVDDVKEEEERFAIDLAEDDDIDMEEDSEEHIFCPGADPEASAQFMSMFVNRLNLG